MSSATIEAIAAPAPLATREQLALETEARALFAHPDVQAIRAKAKGLMLAGFGTDVPDEARARLDVAIDEYVFSYVERVLCRDRNNFCMHYTCHPPYRRAGGEAVPGCRFYGENPDAVYRWGGLDPDRRYRLTCSGAGQEPVDASFTLMSTYGGTTPGDTATLATMLRDGDGGFVLTIDAEPANGRRNHLTMTSSTRLLLVREFLSDWAADTPFAMVLEAEGVTRGGPWDRAAALRDIAHFAIEEIYLYFWMIHIYRNLPPNSVTPVRAAVAMGGSASMATCQGYFELGEDDAVVFTWSPAGAICSSLSALDWWMIPIDAHWRTSRLNNFEAVHNPDGTITAVLSRHDPGVANWIDCAGLRHVLLTARWQSLPDAPGASGAALDATVVPFAELARYLPASLPRRTVAKRRSSNAARLAAYARRTGDAQSKFTA